MRAGQASCKPFKQAVFPVSSCAMTQETRAETRPKDRILLRACAYNARTILVYGVARTALLQHLGEDEALPAVIVGQAWALRSGRA